MSDISMHDITPSWIDGLLQDTWLQVVSLRHGPGFREGEGRQLWLRCVAEIEKVQQALHNAGLSDVSCRHVLIAHCALLDEAVKGRGVQDDACMQWYNAPLQAHFLGTMTAGDTLCQRMRAELNDPMADMTVLICFHRVMLLGFLGTYRSRHEPAREGLMQALDARVPAFRLPRGTANLTRAQAPGRGGLMRWPWLVRIAMATLALGEVWWGLNHWLAGLLGAMQ